MKLRLISALIFYIAIILVVSTNFNLKSDPQIPESAYQSSHQAIAALSSEGS